MREAALKSDWRYFQGLVLLLVPVIQFYVSYTRVIKLLARLSYFKYRWFGVVFRVVYGAI